MYLLSGASSSLQNALSKTGQAPAESSNNAASTPLKNGSDVQSQMEQSLNRSITLVFWLQAQAEPIRLHLEIPTFPLFQLSQFPSLVADLGLSSTSYVDAYNEHTGHWEQRNITTVRPVQTDQRLLFRFRKSLLEGLKEEDCMGLREEVERQPRATTLNGSLKRPAEELIDMSESSKKYQMAEGYQHRDEEYANATYIHANQSYPQNLSVPPHTSATSTPTSPTHQASHAPKLSSNASRRAVLPANAPYLFANNPSVLNSYTPVPLPAYITDPPSPSAPIAYHPHPPLKRWPNDYTVAEIALGFGMMDTLSSNQMTSPAVTQKTAFERVFGCRYVKSTVCRHRGVWRKADAAVRAEFEAMGSDNELALWGEFVRRVEGRASSKTSGKSGGKGQADSEHAQDGSNPHEVEQDIATRSLGQAPTSMTMHQSEFRIRMRAPSCLRFGQLRIPPLQIPIQAK
jgi:hypothetical protein